MVEHFCQLINYSFGGAVCERPARFKHGEIWLCATHYDLVMEYIAGKAGDSFIFGYDPSMTKESVFSIAYKKA